jgi:hypothetical protein
VDRYEAIDFDEPLQKRVNPFRVVVIESMTKKVRKDKKNEVVRSRRAVRWTLRWFSTT